MSSPSLLGNANCIIRMAENNPFFEKIRQEHGHNLGGWVAGLVLVGCTAVVVVLPRYVATSRRTHARSGRVSDSIAATVVLSLWQLRKESRDFGGSVGGGPSDVVVA